MPASEPPRAAAARALPRASLRPSPPRLRRAPVLPSPERGPEPRAEDEILFESLAEYLENLLVGARRRGKHEPLHHQRLDRASGLFARERRHVGDGSAFLHRDGRVGGYSLYLLARGLFLRLVQRLLHHRDEFFVYRAHMRFNADAEAREQLDHFGVALSELFSQIINSDFTHSHHSCHKSVCKFF